MKPDELFSQFVDGFEGRKFSAGLLVAFIDFLKDLGVEKKGFANLDELLKKFPRKTTTAAGKRANTLIVDIGSGKTKSLRPYYNAIERFFRADHKRFDYPSCAPHATQAWTDYRHWLDALVTYSEKELNDLRKRVCDYVLSKLKSQEFDPSTVKVDPPLFRILVEEFDFSAQKREPTGAAFQGLAFGLIRADNPHLQVEIDKVRTGSKRLQRVGDIDAWEGSRLAVSAEVKYYSLTIRDVADLEAFANEVGRRGALGLVVAVDFDHEAREKLIELGLKPLNIDDILDIVELWDPVKQRTAVSSFVYYVKHIEKNAALAERVDSFLEQVTRDAMSSVGTKNDGKSK